jgi:acyl dehydratase
VPVPSDKIGKVYAPVLYAVVATPPPHLDLEAAREAGYPDLLAPAMFVVVYSSPTFMAALFDPELEIDFARLVHGSQAFRWEQEVVAGDEVTTTLTVADISERAGLRFDTFESVSVNQRGETTCIGTWSTIIRGED